MPARDFFHDAVKNALIKDGWIITHDPLPISFGGVDLYVDLGAEKLIAAQKDERKIAVEIKSFLQLSVTSEFHTALGQYLNYRLILKESDSERVLYLAVSQDVYESFFDLLFTRKVIEEYKIKLLVYKSTTEEISLWRS
jgi:XisH protein